jgi:hypothetical protein
LIVFHLKISGQLLSFKKSGEVGKGREARLLMELPVLIRSTFGFIDSKARSVGDAVVLLKRLKLQEEVLLLSFLSKLRQLFVISF